MRGITKAQEVSLDAAEAAKAKIDGLPISELAIRSRIPGVPSLDAATRFGFDMAAEVLSSSRDFAMRLTRVVGGRKR
jgi:hypothetical protein